MHNWKNVWENRSVDNAIYSLDNSKKIFEELKKINGFDVVNSGLSYESLIEQFNNINSKIKRREGEKSIYEVGCGSGANLFLFKNSGFKVGGIDYSRPLAEVARKILNLNDEIVCDDAINLNVEEKYETLLSNSVFSYFETVDYARAVLEKMYEKASRNIILIDVHDESKKDDFIDYRRKIIEDYDERYKNLPKLFYPKEFFVDFARSHDMEIEITDSTMRGYWNNPFVFNCFMYK